MSRGFSPSSPRSASRLAAALLLAAAGVTVASAPATAAVMTTVYASPTGSGTACSSAQPCSITQAQTSVRGIAGAMTGDVVVQLAGGTYTLSSPLTFTAADSGTNGHTVIWQGSASSVISGGQKVTGWTQADAGQNIWKASVGTGFDTRQLYVDGKIATRARTAINRSDFTLTSSGMTFTSSALSYLNNLGNKGRVELESANSFTDRYTPVQSISGNAITMQQPAWDNNTWGWDTVQNPFNQAGFWLENAREFLDAEGEWYLDTATGTLYYKPLAGQNIANADVELPRLQSLVNVGGTLDAPAHDISFTGLQFSYTSWLLPSTNEGYADQQTGGYLRGTWSTRPSSAFSTCGSGCTQFESTRPGFSQMPAAVQVSAATAISFNASKFTNLGQVGIGIGNDANGHTSGVGLGVNNVSVTGSTFEQISAGGIVVGGMRADAHHPSDSRMTVQNVTLANNRVHDVALEYRSHVGILVTYATNATVSHNEIYNLPYSGLNLGYGWGINDPGGSQEYQNRGTYNYQPLYTTATTAKNNLVIGNHIHDTMTTMSDGGGFYMLSASPGTVLKQNYFRTMNRGFDMYFDEGSRHVSVTNNVYQGGWNWAHANANNNNHTGDLTLTDNWIDHDGADITNGTRGNTVTGTVSVSNGNWPSGAQTVMAAAGVQPTQNVKISGQQSGRCVDINGASTTNGAQAQLWDCSGATNQRWTSTSTRQLVVYGNKCLDAFGAATANGTAVVSWDCNGGTNQQWNVNANGTITGAQSGRCLDASGLGTSNATLLVLWDCNGGANQQWSLVP
ncbi:ricin B lectin [Lentzea aerocolonigenes]|uniref:Ricin B lectin n=2 Tax=Lentzea aerocolonigenes TaxID=68170 RepID=A0A0F0GHP6_LENAE|nr:ricin B lectin [Lentzea aerocolonigenes]